MAAPRKQTDRTGLELDYRAGVKSLRVLGKEHGLSASRITQIAEEECWTRDLSARIRAAAESKLNAKILNAEQQAQQKASEKQVIEANATAIADRILEHRTDIPETRSLVMAMLKELRAQTDNIGLLEKLTELLSVPDSGTDKLADLARKVIALPSRADTVKKLTDALKTLIALEREAFNNDDNKSPGQTLDDFLVNLREPA